MSPDRITQTPSQITPELTGYNVVPAIGPNSEEYLLLIKQIIEDSETLLHDILPAEARKTEKGLCLEELEDIVKQTVLTDRTINGWKMLYLGDKDVFAGMGFLEEEFENLAEIYPSQRVLFDDLLANILTGPFATTWLELGETKKPTTIDYDVYGEGRCLECLEGKRRRKDDDGNERRGWLKQNPRKVKSYEAESSSDYNPEVREQIRADFITDQILEEEHYAGIAYAPRCKRHRTPATLITSVHRLSSYINKRKVMVEGRLKSASITYKATEVFLNKTHTGFSKSMIDDSLAGRLRDIAPYVWRKGMEVLMLWSARGNCSFKNRVYVKGYTHREIDDLISEATEQDSSLRAFYTKRIEPNISAVRNVRANEPKWMEVLLPLPGGNTIKVQIVDESEYDKMEGHLDYLARKERYRHEHYSALAWLFVKRITPVMAPKHLQDYMQKYIITPELEKFRDTPVTDTKGKPILPAPSEI